MRPKPDNPHPDFKFVPLTLSGSCGISPSIPQGSINYQKKYAPVYEKAAQEKLQNREPNRYSYWPAGHCNG